RIRKSIHIIIVLMSLCINDLFFFFFFFQAEDGIRDKLVTGVQTCALPILFAGMRVEAEAVVRLGVPQGELVETRTGFMRYRGQRSEERRVGKECRSRWSAYS